MWVRLLSFLGSGGAFGCSGGLVVAAGVEGEVAEDFAGDRVDDADVKVLDDQGDVGSGVGSADADVVESAVVAEGDAAGCVDAVVSDAVVSVGVSEREWRAQAALQEQEVAELVENLDAADRAASKTAEAHASELAAIEVQLQEARADEARAREDLFRLL